MTFILLFTHGSFGHSVRETDRSPVPSDSPLSRNSLLQMPRDFYAYVTRVRNLAVSRRFSGEYRHPCAQWKW